MLNKVWIVINKVWVVVNKVWVMIVIINSGNTVRQQTQFVREHSLKGYHWGWGGKVPARVSDHC